MAWTDACKIEAVKAVEAKMEKGMPAREACKAVSEESEIPAGTLNRWKYGSEKTRKGKKRPPTVRQAWNYSARKLAGLVNYMMEHVEGGADEKIITSMQGDMKTLEAFLAEAVKKNGKAEKGGK